VRVATSVALGIAYAAYLPVVGVSTMVKLALGAMRESGERRVMAALDAHMAEVYWGRYEQGEDALPWQLGAECVCAPRAVAMPKEGAWVAAGSGWGRYQQELLERAGPCITRPLVDLEPRAADQVGLAARGYRRGEVLRPEPVMPVYLRDTVVRAM